MSEDERIAIGIVAMVCATVIVIVAMLVYGA